MNRSPSFIMNLHVVDAIAKASKYINNADEPILEVSDPLAYFAQRLAISSATHSMYQIDASEYSQEAFNALMGEQTNELIVIAFNYSNGSFWPQIPDHIANYETLGLALYPEVNSTNVQALVKDRGCYFLHDKLDSCHLIDKEKVESSILKGKIVFAVFEKKE